MTTLARYSGALDQEERRSVAVESSEALLVRAASDAAPRFRGHAAVVDQRTSIGNPFTYGWYESMASGAFDKTLTEFDQRFLVNHDSQLVVARRSAGDLALSMDSTGVLVDAGLDTRVSYVNDLVLNLEARRITGMSIGFYVLRDEWTTEAVALPNGETAQADVRTILEVKLLEVSAVTFPAYEQTDAGLRAVREARGLPLDRLVHNEDRPAPADATRGEETGDAWLAAALRRLDLQARRVRPTR